MVFVPFKTGHHDDQLVDFAIGFRDADGETRGRPVGVTVDPVVRSSSPMTYEYLMEGISQSVIGNLEPLSRKADSLHRESRSSFVDECSTELR